MSTCPAEVPAGYTAEELERDNPYNQWVYEDKDPDPPEEDPQYCTNCSGSGEGRYEGTRCWSCGGSGTERNERDDDHIEPDE